MSYKIIIDSCGELLERWKTDGHIERASLTLTVDGEEIVDDETFDQAYFLKKIADSPNCPKSSCPSPEKYMEAFDCEADHVYAVTLSANLSGSYNSALLGRNLLLENKPEEGMEFEKVVETVEKYIESQHTYFVLENLETLRKNGRLSNLKAFVATALKIKPVMGSTPEGSIAQLDQARGINKALVKMVDYVAKGAADSKNKVLGITHCNCPARAEIVKEAILKRIPVKDVVLLDTAGVSTMYANDGGIIVVI